MNNIEEEIKKYTLKNAIDYGKARVENIIGKVIKNHKDIPVEELRKRVLDIVKEINKLSREELEREYKVYEAEFKTAAEEKAKESKPKLIIEGAERGHVITRFPPEPGGFIHIGNAKQCFLSDEIAKLYDGKIYLYFDDTNPEKCKQVYVDSIKRDTDWLGIKFAREYYASDFIEQIYNYGEKLIKTNNAYVCTCSNEKIKKDRFEKKECEHRAQNVEINLNMFKDMLNGKYDEGAAIVRLKVDMKAENSTMRDPTIFRIKKTPHYRQGNKYIVWPTYHINTLIVDALNGVTDVVKSKEYEIWDSLHKKLLNLLGLPLFRIHYEARLNIIGTITSKRDMRKLMNEGIIKSWDDPRLVTISALRRRGIQPEAIRAFVLRFGLSMTDSNSEMSALLAENKKIIDPIAKHFFFVSKPISILINTNKDVKMRLHPTKDYGFREYHIDKNVFVSSDDLNEVKEGDIIRLKDLFDIKIKSIKETINAELDTALEGNKIIQWIPTNDFVKCSILIPKEIVNRDGSFNPNSLEIVDGIAEGNIKYLNEHDIVQFERFGYCILDDKEKMQFIFISK
jgi:glutamyl-tRNA synthetase